MNFIVELVFGSWILLSFMPALVASSHFVGAAVSWRPGQVYKDGKKEVRFIKVSFLSLLTTLFCSHCSQGGTNTWNSAKAKKDLNFKNTFLVAEKHLCSYTNSIISTSYLRQNTSYYYTFLYTHLWRTDSSFVWNIFKTVWYCPDNHCWMFSIFKCFNLFFRFVLD